MEVYMNTNKIIHEAVEFILESLEAQGQAPGTLKNYKNSFSVFEKFLNEQGISKIDEDVCLEYIHFKTGRKLHSFNEKILDSSINRRMKPLHLLQMYMDTGEFLYHPRKIKEPFLSPEGFRNEYDLFVEECIRRDYANATLNSNVQKVQYFLIYLDSVHVSSSDEITLDHIGDFIATYDTLSLIHISEPTRLGMISYAVFCLKKKKN